MIPRFSYSIVFFFASILISIEIPQIFAEKFHLYAQQIGLQPIAIIIGSVIGEQIGGYYLSDQWVLTRQKRSGKLPAPEYRLWLSYLGIHAALLSFWFKLKSFFSLECRFLDRGSHCRCRKPDCHHR